MFMVKFDYKQEDRNTKLVGVNISYVNFKNDVHFNMKHKEGKEIIPIFIKAVMFQHVGFYWLIQSIGKIEYAFYCNGPNWIAMETWYDKTFCPNLCGSIFEEFFVTAYQDRYDIMCVP